MDKNSSHSWVVRFFGTFLVLLGILGLILPFIPGWILIIIGALLLGEESRLGKNH